MAKPEAAKIDPSKIIAIPIAEIDLAEYDKWNSRVDLGQASGGKDQTGSYDDLKRDLAVRGQDTPVTACPHPDPKSKFKFVLACGGRRTHGLADIAAGKGEKNPTVLAVIKECTPTQRRTLNVAENTLRRNLSGPDLAFGLYEIFKLDPDTKQGALATQLGVSQTYTSQLLKIMTSVAPDLTAKWRNSPVKLTLNEMSSLCELSDHEKQREAYDTMMKAKVKTEDDADENGNGSLWIASHFEQAKFLGAYLAKLQKAGYIKVTGAFSDAMLTKMFVKGKKTASLNAKASVEQIAEFADAAGKAFKEELAAVDAPKVAEVKAVDVPKTDGKKAGKGAAAN